MSEYDPHEHHRVDDPDTSKAAAHSISPVSADAIMGILLSALKIHGSRTQAELAAWLGLRDAQVWKRLSDLKNRGLIVPSGLTRPGPSGRQQIVWRAVERA